MAFRLFDARTAQIQPIVPATPGLLRVYVHDDALGSGDVGGLRTYVLADLIRRAAEFGGLRVAVYPNVTESGDVAVLDAFNIHLAGDSSASTGADPGSVDIEVGGTGQRAAGDNGGPSSGPIAVAGGPQLVCSGPVSAGNVTIGGLTAQELDPLALRLAFLGRRYREQMTVTPDLIEDAGKTLRRLREQVAVWASEPSAPMSRRHATAVLAAFADDLDTPVALRELHDLQADVSVAPGAKFETFAHLDRLLGLDIARDVGKPGG